MRSTGLIFTRLFLILCVAITLSSSGSFAQTANNGEVFVTNDYRGGSSNTVVVKWFANKVYYQGGFNVYRREAGTTAWTKLNSSPLKVQTQAPQRMIDKDPDVKPFLNIVTNTSYDEFQKGVAKVFVAVKAILNPDFAELLGIIYYDENVETSRQYEYEVRGVTASAEEVVNVSKVIAPGVFVPEAPPQSITIVRKPAVVEINWQPEELRYYGVYVYRKSSKETEWKRVNALPRSVNKSEDQSGNITYPPVFFQDTDIKKDEAYTYRLNVIDYFGQLSEFSQEFVVPVVDFDPPAPPVNLNTSVNVLELSLSWEIQLSDDLAGFKVYRSPGADSTMRVIHNSLLPKEQNQYLDKLLKTGGYYYSVAAVDSAGNEGMSEKIFIEVRDVTPPAPPQQVFVNADTGRVVLTWARNPEPDVRGYYVYRSLHDGNHADNEFIIVNTKPIVENTYTEILPKNVRNKFVYAVVAEDLSYNRSKLSAVSIVGMPDVTPPSRPLIKNVSVQENTLVVEWLPNPDRDLAGYHIFRSVDSLSYERVNVNPYPANTYRYTDRQIVPNQRYYYYLQAIDSAGNASSPSNVFTALNKRLGGVNIAPSDVRVEYVRSRKEVKLSWKLPEEDDLVGAVIYRSSDAVNFRPVTGVIKEASFSDRDVKKGITYYYQVRSYTSSGVIARSEILKATVAE